MNQQTGKTNISQRRKARNLLVQALYQWQMSGNPALDIEAEFKADNGKKNDWEFFHAAFKGITGDPDKFDNQLLPFLDRELSKLNPVELAILRLGSYEFSERIDVPYKVVINECVDLAKKYGAAESHKYINGVLDKAALTLRAIEKN